MNSKHLFLTVLEAASLRSWHEQVSCLIRTHFHIASYFFRWKKGQGISLEHYPWGLYPHELITCQRPHLLILSLWRGRISTNTFWREHKHLVHSTVLKFPISFSFIPIWRRVLYPSYWGKHLIIFSFWNVLTFSASVPFSWWV